jgi:hypothetical protein
VSKRYATRNEHRAPPIADAHSVARPKPSMGGSPAAKVAARYSVSRVGEGGSSGQVPVPRMRYGREVYTVVVRPLTGVHPPTR